MSDTLHPCDLVYSVGFCLYDPDHFTPRAVNNTALTHAFAEDDNSNDYIIRCSFTITDPDYRGRYNIDGGYHCAPMCQINLGRESFDIANGDTILNSTIKAALATKTVSDAPGDTVLLTTRGHMANAPFADTYTAVLTMEVVRDKHTAHIKSITIRIPRPTLESIVSRLKQYCRQCTQFIQYPQK
jgi:hypothetical protein